MDNLGGDNKTWCIYVLTDSLGESVSKSVNGQDNLRSITQRGLSVICIIRLGTHMFQTNLLIT
jgi:hypothetical protein